MDKLYSRKWRNKSLNKSRFWNKAASKFLYNSYERCWLLKRRSMSVFVAWTLHSENNFEIYLGETLKIIGVKIFTILFPINYFLRIPGQTWASRMCFFRPRCKNVQLLEREKKTSTSLKKVLTVYTRLFHDVKKWTNFGEDKNWALDGFDTYSSFEVECAKSKDCFS